MATADPQPSTSGATDTKPEQVRSGLVARHEVTHETGLVFWGDTRSCVMSDGGMVIYSKTSDDAPAEIYVYNKHGQKIKTLQRVCQHEENINLLSLTINNTEYLTVSCADCQKIYLYNPDTAAITTAFHHKAYRPGSMCHGSPGTVCAVHLVKGHPVLVLDCTTPTFQLKHTVQTNMEGCYDICYIPVTDVIVISDTTIIRAVSCSSNKKLWEVTGSVDGAVCDPHGMVYSHRHHSLLAADGRNRRILVLQPESGSCLQTIDLSPHVGSAWQPYLHEENFILYHLKDRKPKISYYTLYRPEEWTEWEIAFKEVCRMGTTRIFRVRINLIGYTKAGKSSLARKLLGKPFLQDIQSTEGIYTQLIVTTFDEKNEVVGTWEEVKVDTDKIAADFTKKVLATTKQPNIFTGGSGKEERMDAQGKQGSDKSFIVPYNLRRKRSRVQSTVEKEPRRKKSKNQKQVTTGASGVASVSDDVTPARQPGTESSKVEMDTGTFRQLNKQKKSQSPLREDSKRTTECHIRLWDHGGQLEFLTTHHLFLDADAVNLIVMDITKKLHQEVTSKHGNAKTEAVPKTGAQFLDYWLNMIHQKATSSGIDPAVAIILTHLDQVTPSEADEYIQTIIRYGENKPHFKYISSKNIFTVDNKNENVSEFNQFRKEIFQMATKQKSWGMERPTRWLKLEASIHEEAEAKSLKCVNTAEVQKLASRFGINKKEVDSFLQFHHSMGDFVHYSDETLRELVVTDPQWLVDMFKALITAHEFLDERRMNRLTKDEYKNKGLLSKSALKILWKGNDVKFLTALMMKFHLIVPLSNSIREYLVPCMLPPRQLNIYETRLFQDMMMIYSSPHGGRSQDNFLPVGSFHRLLAALSSSTSWKLCVKDHLTYSDASFEVEYGVRVALTLLKYIRVTVWCGSQAFKNTALRVLPNIREIISENSKKVGLPTYQKFLIICPQQQLAQEFDNNAPCLVPVSATDASFDPEAKRCYLHDMAVHREDFDWLLKVRILPDSYADRNFPTLKSMTKDVSKRQEKVPRLSHIFPIMMSKDWRQFVATVSQGKGQTLKPPDSAVSLTIPDGVHAVLQGCVHTDHSRFVRAFPKDECIISPMVEFHHHHFSEEEETKHKFTIRIPHCIPKKSMWKHIRVRRGDIYTDEAFTDIERVRDEGSIPDEDLETDEEDSEYDDSSSDESVGTDHADTTDDTGREQNEEVGSKYDDSSGDESVGTDHTDTTDDTGREQDDSQESCYEMDENFITIHTKHFTDFTCTMCDDTFCSNMAMVFLFGSLLTAEEKTLVKIQPFLCSFLYVIEDYKMKLLKAQAKLHQSLLNQQSISLPHPEFDPRNNEVSLKLTTESSDWRPFSLDDISWSIEKRRFLREKILSEVMYFNGEHICKSPQPFDATTFDLRTPSIRQSFDGEFQLTIRAEVMTDRATEQSSIAYRDIKETSIRISALIAQNRSPVIEPLVLPPTFKEQISGILKDAQISKLARQISSKNMSAIAAELFELSFEEIDNVSAECRDNVEKFNRDILIKWRNRSTKHTRQKLAQLLYEAADEGMLNSEIVDKTLKVKRSDLNNNEPE